MNIDKLVNYILKNEDNLNDLFKVLSKYNLNYLLIPILQKIQKLQNRELHINSSKLVSARPLDSQTLEMLENKYNLKFAKQKIDQNIIAGYKLYTKDKMLDHSLQLILNRLKI